MQNSRNKKIKICYIVNDLNGFNGWSRNALNVIEPIKKGGNEVICITESLSGKKIKQYKLLLNPLKYLSNLFVIVKTAIKINKIINGFKPDIIHFLVEPYTSLILFINPRGAKVVLTVCGTYSIEGFFHNSISRILIKAYYSKIDGLISISKFTLNRLLRVYPSLKTKTVIIPPSINLSTLKVVKKANNKVRNILFVGQVKARKGVWEAIEAINKYKLEYSNNFLFNIVGHLDENSTYHRKLAELIAEYNLEENVKFIGEVSDSELNKLYFNADVFLMLSIDVSNNFEGYGMVYIEANARGVPVIGSINSGAEDAIKDSVSGFLVDPKDSSQIAQKLHQILELKKIKKASCLKWAKSKNTKIISPKILEFYRSLFFPGND